MGKRKEEKLVRYGNVDGHAKIFSFEGLTWNEIAIKVVSDWYKHRPGGDNPTDVTVSVWSKNEPERMLTVSRSVRYQVTNLRGELEVSNSH